MAKESIAFRVQAEDKAYIYDLTGSLNVPVSKFLEDLCEDMKNGRIAYNGKGFSAKGESKGVTPQKSAEISPLNADDIDLTELRAIAADRRVTPQSVLNNALKPYKRGNAVQSDE